MGKIVVIGAKGQLGSELCKQLGDESVGLYHGMGTDSIEITNIDHVFEVLQSLRPKIVINTAAFNQVDKADRFVSTAFRQNAIGPKNLAEVCNKLNATLIHLSTDYVFGQAKTRKKPYFPDDCPGPVNTYGITKLAGENFVRAKCPNHIIIRTCGLYSHTGKNFVRNMLDLGKRSKKVNIPKDQICTPTNVEDLAEQMVLLIERGVTPGTYHITNSGEVSWWGFTHYIFNVAKYDTIVNGITSVEFLKKYVVRPHYSVLDNYNSYVFTAKKMRPWYEAVEEFVQKEIEFGDKS